MVVLQVSAPSEPARQILVRKFPFRIGRSEGNDFQTAAPGVWAEHLVIEFKPAEGGIFAVSSSDAVTLLNGQRLRRARLRTGDLLKAGACAITFTLAPPVQRSLRAREVLAWGLVLSVSVLQAAIIILLGRS